MGPAYSADGDPHVIRVRSVTATGFQWQIDEWDYLAGDHTGAITVHYFAITPGSHTFGTQHWQVGRVAAVNRTDTAVALTGFTDPPAVLTQVETTNNLIATNNPRALKTRNSAVTATTFNVNVETQLNYTTAITSEGIGYVAVSLGIGYLDGKVLWADNPGTVGNALKTFYTGPFTNPVVVAQTQTKADAEPGDLRMASLPVLSSGSTRVQFTFQEETSGNADLTHAQEQVAGLFIGDMPGEAAAKLVVGNVSVNQTAPTVWQKVNLATAYTAPIVVFGPLSRTDAAPAFIRVRNVLAVDPANANHASFEYRVQEWDFMDGVHTTETASYMVMEQGLYAIGGQVVQAGTSTGVTDTGKSQNMDGSYWSSDIYFEREPAIFSQCVTVNEASAVTTRVDTIDTIYAYPPSFRVRLTEAENADHTHAAETVHFIVIPAGSGQFLSTNSNYRFSTGVGTSISSTLATGTFAQKYAAPSIFAAAQGDADATIGIDGFYETLAATDLDPIAVRYNALTPASVGLVADEDTSGVTNNTHSAEVQAWLVLQGAPDADGDGVSDAIEAQMGTDPNLATTPTNASGGAASDLDTLLSLYSLTATVGVATAYETVDKTATTLTSQAATIKLARSYGTMPLTLKVTPANGSTDITKGNASASDYSISGISGSSTITIPAGQGTTASPFIVSVNPVRDSILEVPENLKLSFGPVPSGANPQIVNLPTFVRICDADPTNINNRTMYVAYLTRAPGVVSTGSGVATAQLEGDNDNAKVSVNVGGLSSVEVSAYLRINNDQDIRNNLGSTSPLTDVVWNIRAAAAATTDQAMLDELRTGEVYLDINTTNYNTGEITGHFNKANGTHDFDPNRPDLIAPALPGTLTAVEAERDIYRFLDQSTFGATTASFNDVKAAIEAVDGTISDGATSAGMITGYTNWLTKQMDLAQTPSPNFLALVLAADNEEFALRGAKPIQAGQDPQYAGQGYAASYDAFGNLTNPYQTTTNNIYAFNSPQNAANRRREWWTMVLNSKDQVRQRMAAALQEILVISENDTTILAKHYGAANYWDMLAQGAFGKYRDLLEKVTYSPMMATYLSHLRNRAHYVSGGIDIYPDENYAREVMQLFTIGLVLRHPDGSLVLGPDALPIPTYNQTDITELARVMTGLTFGARHAAVTVRRLSTQGYALVPTSVAASPQIEFQGVNFTDFNTGGGEAFFQAPYIYPLKAIGRYNGITYHDFNPYVTPPGGKAYPGASKVLFASKATDAQPKAGETVIPYVDISGMSDIQTYALADNDLRLAHNALAGDPAASTYNGHQNTPVVISRELIQRLVTSNPSPGYLYRVSEAYRSTNGNLGAVMKAILLDYEARSLEVPDTLPGAGKQKEPLMHFASMFRALKATSSAPLASLNTMAVPFTGSDSPSLTPYPSSELAKFPLGTTRMRLGDQTPFIGQSPQKAPSVFNWFLPDYVQPGTMADAGLFGPELQINTESNLVNRVNRQYNIALMNLTAAYPGFSGDDFVTNASNSAARLLTDVTTLTFDSTNWNTAQTVTVRGYENGSNDGPLTSSILHTVASADANYTNIYTPPLAFNISDNDTAPAKLVAVSQSGGTTVVTEGGATDTYTVVLTAPPAATTTVTVTPAAVKPWQTAAAPVASTDVTISPASLTFTDTNWNVPQTVTITAVDDAVADSFLVASAPYNVRAAVIRNAVTSTDPDYNGSQVSDFNCTVNDNDTAPRRFVPGKATATGIPVVTEGGATDNYTVAFATSTAPTANVTLTFNYDNSRLALSCTDTTFATPSAGVATLTITPSTYTSARTITLTAVNDAVYQGVQFKTITHSTTSTDTAYNGLTCAPVIVRVNDNDDAPANGISVIETWGASAAVEGGMTDTYHVVLDKLPTGTVTLTWSGNNGDVSGIGNLTFTTANWNVPQTVTLSATDDLAVETTHVSPIKYVASGGGYTNVKFVNAIIGDNDLNTSAGVLVTQSGGTTAVTEGGATDTIDVKLAGQPNSDVTVTMTVAPAQATLSSNVLTFTPSNWNTTQTVTVTAVDDLVVEGPHSATITTVVTGTDSRYNNFAVGDINVAITDNDVGSRIVIAPTGGTTEVTEGGATDVVNISLSGPTAPTANVVVNLAATGSQVTFSPAVLTFTPANWTTAQAVTVTAVNDTIPEVVFTDTITATTDASQPAGFLSLSSTSPVTVNDNDDAANAANTIQIIQTNGATRVVEGGMTDTIEVALRRAPTANVTLTASQSPAGQLSLSTGTLTFTPTNWFIPQTVTITAVDDAVVEGAMTSVLTYTANAAGGYVPADIATVNVAIGDNEASNPMVIVTGTSGSVTELSTPFTYNITLGAAPNASTTVRVTPSAYFQNAVNTSQVTFSPTSLDFTNATTGTTAWNRTATVTVTAIDNAVAEPTINMSIVNTTAVVSGTDTRYNGMVANDVALTVVDNDTATGRIAVTESGGSTVVTEDSGTDTVDVALVGPAPASDVIVTLTRSGSQFRFLVNGLAVDTTTLTFTPANYTTVQTVTLIAIADTGSEGVHSDTLNLTTASTAPAGYASLSTTVPVRMLDSDDLARSLINLVQSGGNTRVVEGGATDSYTVVLRRAPSANVILTPYYNTAQIGLSVDALTFTPANWNVPQTVTVTAVDDTEVEGSHSASVTYYASNTGGYLPTDSATTGTIYIGDNDVAGSSLVTVTESGGYTLLAEGSQPTDTYTVVLGAAPKANVTITPQAFNSLGGTNLVTLSPASLTFTPANYTTPQTVTITLAPSATNNGNRAVFIGNTIASTDLAYANYSVPTVNAIVTDANETTAAVGILATGANTTVNEAAGAGHTDTVYVYLKKPPTATVTVTPSINPSTQASFSPATLTFTTTNWNIPQILTITGTDDGTVEASPHVAVLTCTPSATGGYALTGVGTHNININDNDQTGKLVITQGSSTVQEGGYTTYTVKLSSMPSAPVTVTIITERHARPEPNIALTSGYFSANATASNLQKDNFLFDWSELTTIYTNAYTADRGANPETVTTAPLGHLAGTKAVIDKLDLLWGGGHLKAKWPDGSPATNNPRQVLIDGILNSFVTNRLSTDTTNFPIEVRDRCRYAAYLVGISPTAVTSH